MSQSVRGNRCKWLLLVHERSWGNDVETVSTSSSSLTWWPEWATSLVEESWPDRQQSKLRAEQSNCLGRNWIETRILFLWPSPNMLYDRQWRSVTHQYICSPNICSPIYAHPTYAFGLWYKFSLPIFAACVSCSKTWLTSHEVEG